MEENAHDADAPDEAAAADEADAPDAAREPLAGPAEAAVCPFLVSAAGPWRSAEPTRDHRCSRLSHAIHLELVHQRRYCLGSGGPGCPHFVTARAPGRFVSMLPVVLDRGPLTANLEQEGVRRAAAPATVVIVGAALGVMLLVRGPGAPAPTPVGSSEPTLAPSLPTPGAPSSPPSNPPSSSPPSPSPAVPTTRPSQAPRPSASPATTGGRTYTVRPGDTLGAIAARFGTSTGVLVKLNGIANPSLIHTGDVLKLP